MVFKALDKDHNGKLGKAEFITAWKENFDEEVPEAELDSIFSKIDLNKNGQLGYKEFINVAINLKEVLTDEKLEKMYATMSVNSVTYEP